MNIFRIFVDEQVVLHKRQFRVRIWRTADSNPSLALLSQVQGSLPPDWYSSQLANLVLRSFLGYSLPIPIFFELSRWNGKTRAFRVRYETIGCDLRPILPTPITPLSTPR